MYKKNKGDAGLSGVQFQLNLLTVSFLNVLHNRRNWRISTENSEGGKFDDIVIELPEKSAVLIQSKYKDSKKITKEQLLSHNSKNADFSLPKYFFSYEEIKDKFKTKTVIICTNTEVDTKGLENVITSQTVNSDSMLHYEDHNYSFFTLNENILPDLKANAKIYYSKNLQGKGVDKKIITKENIRDFLENLQFFSSYPSGDKLDKIIAQLLSRSKNSTLLCKISSQEIYRKIEDWFKQPKGEYLTEVRAKAMFCEIKSDKYSESLQYCHLSFEHCGFSFINSKRIFHVKTAGGHLLQTLKIYRALKEYESKKLFLNPDESIEVQKQMIEAFELPRYTFLIMVWSKTAEQVSDKLRQILERYQYKKVIFVCEGDNVPSHFIEPKEVTQLDSCITLEDFSKDSQERLLKNENIVFQGEIISLEELFVHQTNEDYTKSLDLEMLEKLARGEEVKVGVRPLDLDEDTSHYYIDRTFVREIQRTEHTIKYNKKKEDTFSEEGIYDVTEKMVLIVDVAGMGKSIVLTKLTAAIKQKYPHLWVIKINLNDYTKILREFLNKDMKTITAIQLLNSKQATKLINSFEELVFSTREKVVLLLDGVDEISPDYTDLIVDLLRQCQQANNFAKIFVTARPHVAQEMEGILQFASFKMIPFTIQNQTDFLTKYWMHTLKLENTNKDKCEEYAKALLNKMSSWIESHKENSFTGIPLQVRMTAEIFQENPKWNESTNWEGCSEYVSGYGGRPKLPEKFNIAELYDIFIDKKRSTFVHKESPNGIPAANRALTDKFDECLNCHRSLALKEILDGSKSDLFPCCRPRNKNIETYVLKLGILQKLGDQLQFLHRTFAEFFVAQNILKELEIQNSNLDFQKLLIDEILVRDEFYIVRAFLDNFLKGVVDSLPGNIFENYMYKCMNGECMSGKNLMFVLSKEGCVAILQLIFNTIRFKMIGSVKVKIVDCFNRICRNTNTLKDLQTIMQKGGVNVRDRKGNMPLHYAVRGGHLETAKFLIDQGAGVDIRSSGGFAALHLASHWGKIDIVTYLTERGIDINSRSNDGRTVLHLAVRPGNLEAANLNDVKCLVELGADINTKDSYGRTALNLAAEDGNLDIVEYLVECGTDINNNDGDGPTALHSAVEYGHLDIAKYLVGRGADINSKDSGGRTALHSAAEFGNLESVRYLIERGVDINSKGTDNGPTALHLAAEYGCWQTIEFLVERGADINSRNSSGRTALHAAVYFGMWHTVTYLVEHGADIKIKDDEGETVLHSTAKSGNFVTVKYLVECGSDINSRDDCGETVLHSAVNSGDLNTITYLVEGGADVKSRDGGGCTVLHSAAKSCKLNAVKLFVECGVDINVKDNNGHTALDLAPDWFKKKIIQYLQEIDIDIDTRNSHRWHEKLFKKKDQRNYVSCSWKKLD